MGNQNSDFTVSVIFHSEDHKNEVLSYIKRFLRAIRDVTVIDDYRDSDFNIDIAASEYDDYIFLGLHFERSFRGRLRGLMNLVRDAILKELKEANVDLAVHGLSDNIIGETVEQLAQEKLSNLWKITEFFYAKTVDIQDLRSACEEIVKEFEDRCLEKVRK